MASRVEATAIGFEAIAIRNKEKRKGRTPNIVCYYEKTFGVLDFSLTGTLSLSFWLSLVIWQSSRPWPLSQA